MKHRNIIRSIFAAVVVAAGGAWAETETVGGYTWTYRINGDTVEIYKDDGRGHGTTAISPSPTGLVTIPSTLGGHPVTSIGDGAFRACQKLTGITIPNGVTSIGDYAFCGCWILMSVTIPDSVINIGAEAFVYCYGLTSVTIPNSLTRIENGTFDCCKRLSGVTIPNTVTSIGNYAIRGCIGLTTITIPVNVTNIGDCAFSGCSGLLSFVVDEENSNYSSSNGLLLSKDGKTLIAGVNGDVVIPNGVTNIKACAFYDFTSLTSVAIPDSVMSIGACAFSCCTNLSTVRIPDSVTSIGGGAFYGCRESLYDVTTVPGVKMVDGWAIGYTGTLSGNLNLTGIRGIGDCAFEDCNKLTSVIIPSSVKSIGFEAFKGCCGLTNVKNEALRK